MSTYTLPDLPYDYGALEPHYSAKILELHHDKHHAAYVKGLNDTMDQLAEARDKDDFGSIVGPREEPRLQPVGPRPALDLLDEPVARRRRQARGRAGRRHRRELRLLRRLQGPADQATTTVQGSGWGVLAWEPLGQRLYVEQVYDHQGNVGQSGVNLLVFDAWEHAFYLQYLNVKADYVKALWNIVNWDDVARRFAAAKAGRAVPASRGRPTGDQPGLGRRELVVGQLPGVVEVRASALS